MPGGVFGVTIEIELLIEAGTGMGVHNERQGSCRKTERTKKAGNIRPFCLPILQVAYVSVLLTFPVFLNPALSIVQPSWLLVL